MIYLSPPPRGGVSNILLVDFPYRMIAQPNVPVSLFAASSNDDYIRLHILPVKATSELPMKSYRGGEGVLVLSIVYWFSLSPLLFFFFFLRISHLSLLTYTLISVMKNLFKIAKYDFWMKAGQGEKVKHPKYMHTVGWVGRNN